ncbi:DUF4062 domain-containing protein [Paraburkholderia sp. BR10882]|uniref:DUF4062 domain-containing protein n=1 Tax=unclassified Paraburkholderia TaxID=2615204 RepID=UPI0034CEBB83
MRIFVSSSFEDLKEHRAAAIRVLRQLGHEVLAMEDLVAAASTPLNKVLEMVDRSDAYVGLFGWRYGYVPGAGFRRKANGKDTMLGADSVADGETSITHFEYLRALERGIPIMAFLLDEQYPWPPQLIDGFDAAHPQAQPNTKKIRALRQKLQLERIVSWFTTPTDLEARVGTAVTMAGLTRQLNLEEAQLLPAEAGAASDSAAGEGIKNAIVAAGDIGRALKIDLATSWWSTRLYLIAALANRFTQVKRILVVDSRPADNPQQSPPPVHESPALRDERFVGQLSVSAILAMLEPPVIARSTFLASLQVRPVISEDTSIAIDQLVLEWACSFNDMIGNHIHEQAVKVDLTAERLRRRFGDAMLQQPIRIADLKRASEVDILRLLDYPNDFVPVVTRVAGTSKGTYFERVDMVDKVALNARLARSYLEELLDRARIR